MVLLHTGRDGYAPSQVIDRAMSVRELIDFLESEFDEDEKVLFSNDNGYTYGWVSEGRIGSYRDDEEDYE